jgi:hypothetical protein
MVTVVRLDTGTTHAPARAVLWQLLPLLGGASRSSLPGRSCLPGGPLVTLRTWEEPRHHPEHTALPHVNAPTIG